MAAPSPSAAAWAASGAMFLTGRDGEPPLVPPDGIIERMLGLGSAIGVDVLPLLGERAAALRLTRLGDTSAGRAARLLPVADGWLAVNLPHDEDLGAIPAWLEAGEPGSFPWAFLRSVLADRTAAGVVERAVLLGLPVARVGEVVSPTPVHEVDLGASEPGPDPPLVVDLSSLWAGPLCARLLRDHGARVVKVESTARPDGARLGPPAFYDRLHRGDEEVVLDFANPAGRAELERLLAAADVVIDGSRARALRHLGIDAERLVAAADGPKVWVSITGHGRASERVAFGDDAAAAGGLVAFSEGGGAPSFVADAVADPLTGVAAAAAVAAAWARGGRWLLDVALARVAASVAAGSTAAWTPDVRLIAAPPTLVQ